MAVEEAPFELLAKGGKDGELQLRRYGATIVAETLVEGDRDAASTQGFKVIADYIFGNNQAAGPPSQASGGKASGGTPSEKIAMTAPVVAEPLNRSQKIAMTAPVTATDIVNRLYVPRGAVRSKYFRVSSSRTSTARGSRNGTIVRYAVGDSKP